MLAKTPFVQYRFAHGLLVVLLVGAAFFLCRRAQNENRWSDWWFGDAQTLLSTSSWNGLGWIKNKFLFLPTAYTESLLLLDDPALRQHAHGIAPRGRVGPRLWYTHYPSGYLIPHAFLSKLGLSSRSMHRYLAILFSLGGLVFFYLFLSRLTDPMAGLLGTVFYLFCPGFLNYADSLANHPIDDFLRLLIMYLILVFSEGRSQRLFVSVICLQLILSLSSYDSVFYVYLWILGCLAFSGTFSCRRILIVTCVPLLGMALQFAQNSWYLGVHDALDDLITVYQSRNISSGFGYHLWVTFHFLKRNLISIFGLPAGALYLLAAFLTSLFFSKVCHKRYFAQVAIALFCCGFAYPYVFPGCGWEYQDRQFIPLVAFLIAVVVSVFFETLQGLFIHPTRRAFQALLIGTELGMALHSLYIVDRKPRFHMSQSMVKDIELAKGLRPSVSTDTIVFSHQGFSTFMTKDFFKGFPQIEPVVEYYAGKPILAFSTEDALLRDLKYFVEWRPNLRPLILVKRFSKSDWTKRLTSTFQQFQLKVNELSSDLILIQLQPFPEQPPLAKSQSF